MGAYKNILIDVSSTMNLAAQNLTKAADSMDSDLMEDVIANVMGTLILCFETLVENK